MSDNSTIEWTDATWSPMGKKRAGRELDGRTWDEYPPQTVTHA